MWYAGTANAYFDDDTESADVPSFAQARAKFLGVQPVPGAAAGAGSGGPSRGASPMNVDTRKRIKSTR